MVCNHLGHIVTNPDAYIRWLGAFLCVSAFNNVGMSLINLNMVGVCLNSRSRRRALTELKIPFRTCAYPLITMSLLTLAGNTAYVPRALSHFATNMFKISNSIENHSSIHVVPSSQASQICQAPRGTQVHP
jgi:Trk-type K+ transport system membrane component